MKIDSKADFFYIRSGAEYASDIPAEEFNGDWRDVDQTRRIEIIAKNSIAGVTIFNDLYEVHLSMRGRKSLRMFKFTDNATYQKMVNVLQSVLDFDLT